MTLECSAPCGVTVCSPGRPQVGLQVKALIMCLPQVWYNGASMTPDGKARPEMLGRWSHEHSSTAPIDRLGSQVWDRTTPWGPHWGHRAPAASFTCAGQSKTACALSG
jgi:hypothetical protein